MILHLDVEGCELCEKHDSYTTEPTHLRIFTEHTMGGRQWTVDGADDLGHYTEDCWSFGTFREAADALEDFVKDVPDLDWKWRDGRHRDDQ